MSERIKVFVWATDTAGCFYQRLKLPLDALVARYPDEFEVCWSCEPTRALSNEGPTVVVGQRIMGNGDRPDPTWLEMCEAPGVLAVYEIDDDILDLDPGNTVPYNIFTPNRAGTVHNILWADEVIASTPMLAAKMRRVRDAAENVEHDQVTVAPNCIRDGSVVERRNGPRQQVTIGWAGSMFHQQDFTPELVAQLAAVRDAFPDVRWVSIGANYFGWGSTFGWGPIETYHKRLEFIDIGIAPIARTDFNRSKSWIKALDYMSKGAVPVVEEWGQYPELLAENPHFGVEVYEPDEWTSALTTAIARLRDGDVDHDAIADRAREFEISNQMHIWADVFRRARDL